MKSSFFAVLAVASLLSVSRTAFADEYGHTEDHAHYDVAPFFQNGKLLTGGQDHSGVSYPPPIRVYGYEFGEDVYDPFNPADPGVNQRGSLGQLPPGAPLRYNLLSGLRYWDGKGLPMLAEPPTGAHLSLSMGTSVRTLTGTSGAQPDSLIQAIASDGSVHKHFIVSLFGAPGASNVPGEAGYVEPAAGIYAFGLKLTLTHDDTTYVSDPFWVVFNNGLGEEQHEAVMHHIATSIVPEPSGLAVLALALPLLSRHRR